MCISVTHITLKLHGIMSSTFVTIFLLLVASEFVSCAICASISTRAIVLPITKGSGSSQYTTHIKQRTPLINVQLALDLGGQFLFVDCETDYVSSSYKPANCRQAACALAKSGCGSTCFGSPKPGCNNNTCTLYPYNEFMQTSTIGEVAQDIVTVHTTDGASFGPIASVPNFIFICAPTFLLDKLAKGSKGVAGLGRGKLGMPSLFATTFRFPRTFAICLASKGFAIFGNTPYNFLPSNTDYSKYLTYTPLIVNPVSTAGTYTEGDKSTDYFIGVTSIQINKTPVNLNTTLLSIHKGFGGTKLSTVEPYTVLETSIYNSLISTFKKAAPSIPTVAPVSPFGLCYHTKSFQDTYLGPAVPQIDLILNKSGGMKWYIYGANSMVQVGNGVMCLGFVDGGVRPRTSIVLGAYQLDQHLLQFDLGRNRLGFSISMRSLRSSCSNFNFGSNA